MSELYGTPSGFRAYDKDQAELAQMAAQTDHQQALAGLNRAQASTMLGKQKTEEELLRLAAGQGPQAQTVDGISAQLLSQAGLRARIGQFEEAGKILKDLAQVNSATSTAKAADARAAKSELDAHLDRLNFVRDRLAAVRDPASHATAMMQLQADPEIGKALPDWLKRFNLPAIRGFVAGSDAEIARIKLSLDQAAEARQAGEAKSRTETRKAALALNERRTAAYEERQSDLKKAGAGELAMPPKSVIDAMEGELKTGGYDVSGKEERRVQAVELAEAAAIIKAQRPTLGWTEARAFAIAEALKDGSLTPGTSWLPDKIGGAAKFTPKPGSITRPLPTPTSPKELQVNKHYRAPDGSLVLYTGKAGKDAFKVVLAPMQSRRGPTLPPVEPPPLETEEE